MASAFGFSTGDFVTSFYLVKDIIKALNDTKDSKEYLQVITELRGLEVALIQVRSPYDRVINPQQKATLQQILQECDASIKDFLESLEKYHGHLSAAGSGNRWKDGVRKIQWRLCKIDELASFRPRISLHVAAIELLLAADQTSQLYLSSISTQAQEQELKSQTTAISALSDPLNSIGQSIGQIQIAFAQLGAESAQALLMNESIRQLLISQHTETMKTFQRFHDSIPPQVPLQKSITFLDALGRRTPMNLEWINSYDAFYASLKARFTDHGLQMIEENRFVIQDTKTKRDIDFKKAWDICFVPGLEYDMSMLFHQGIPLSSQAICTSCYRQCAGTSGEEITCEHCDTTFRHVVDAPDNDANLRNGEGSLSRKLEHEFQIHDFRRVRIICTKLRRSTGGVSSFVFEDLKGVSPPNADDLSTWGHNYNRYFHKQTGLKSESIH